MKDIFISNHLTKSDKHRNFKQRLCHLTKTLKRQTKETKLISLGIKNVDCSESILSTNDSYASEAVNFNKRKLKKKALHWSNLSMKKTRCQAHI